MNNTNTGKARAQKAAKGTGSTKSTGKVRGTARRVNAAKRTAKKTGKPVVSAKGTPVDPRNVPMGTGTIAKTKAATVIDRAFGLDAKAPYSGTLTANRAHFSAYTIAAFVAAGCVKISPSGSPTKAPGNVVLWGMIVGKVARSYWKKAGRIDDTGLTVAGLNEIQARITGKSKGYDTQLPLVAAFADAMRKSGRVTLDKAVYTLTVEHGALRK